MHGKKGFVAYAVLNAAGVLCRRFGRHTDIGEKCGEHRVALVGFLGDSQPGIGEVKVPQFIHGEISSLFEKPHCAAYTGLGVAHFFTYINGANAFSALGKDVYGFKIHFAGFLKMHGITSFELFRARLPLLQGECGVPGAYIAKP